MKNNLGKNFLILLLILFMPITSFAEVSRISFVTDEQKIKPNTPSSVITINFYDSSDGLKSMGETSDLFLETSSPTGEFSSSVSNWESVDKLTVNSNWTNRSFYYRDSGEGDFIISARLIARSGGEGFSANQKITVSSSDSYVADDNNGEVLGATTPQTSETSATSGVAIPSYAVASSQLEVSAGNNRLTSVGSPINFQAFIKKNTSSNGSVSFSWSFGDGEVGSGALVTHIYKYPGEYAVVLNAKSGNVFATSRLKVKVINPDITLYCSKSDEGNFIEITNNSNQEINLFNWKIISGRKGFIFQPDTIIFPKASIRIDKAILTMKGEIWDETVLFDFLGNKVSSVATPMSNEEIENISNKIDEANRQTLDLIDRALSLKVIKEAVPVSGVVKEEIEESKGKVAGESVEYLEMLKNPQEPAPLGEVIYESPKEEGFLIKLTNFIKRVFSE